MIMNFDNPNDKRRYTERWPLASGKRLFKVIDERSSDGTEELLSVSHITGITPRSQKKITMFKSESLIGYKKCAVGDIAANTMWTWQGAIGVSKYDGVVSPAYNVYKQREEVYNSQYLDLLLREKHLIDVYHSISTGIRPSRLRLYPEPFMSIALPVPPFTEQEQIVRFLDWKVSGINKLINIKKKEIEELRLIRQKKIDLTLNHIFDKNSTCSDWVIRPLKYFVTSNDESLTNSTLDDYEFDYIDISSVGFGYLKQSLEHYTFAEAPSRARRIVKPGDTIISTVRTYLRSMTYISEDLKDCIVSTGFSVLRPKKFVYPQVLNYALSCNYFIDEVIKKSIGVSYPAINDNALLQIKISLPSSIEEQKSIVQQLEQDLSMVDKLIDVLQKEIHLLHEFKTRLISDVVTGQIDVRDIEVPDYDFVDETTDADSDSKDEQEYDEEQED